MEEPTQPIGAQTPRPAEAAAEEEITVLSCGQCQGPLPSNLPKCLTCGAPRTGKEFPYIPRRESTPDVTGMIKWWAILSGAVFVLGGFSFSGFPAIAIAGVSLFYGLRIAKIYFS